ncbi:alpha/beta fold hydrolase [Streptomyces sp. NBC_00063]|uniref:alpha/beta hydrolase n=1 Tax=Streptomyces sp. NBC_00063 TaxID=2975638 RepID=UPI003D7031C5
MTTNRITLDFGDARITGVGARGRRGMPLLVRLLGGGYNAAYFDVPGYSLVDAAQRVGFPVAALDRPGYGGSTALQGEISFRRNAEVLDRAIAELWRVLSFAATGVVLVGHSIGGAIALHLAAGERTWPLLGISVTGIHDASRVSWDAFESEPPGSSTKYSRADIERFMYGPEGTYDPGVIDAAQAAESPAPVAELLEVAGRWPAEFPEIAARVDVAVHYGLAEHDQLWFAGDETVAAFARAFASAPSVAARCVPGCGHNIDHHYAGAAFHQEQLDFARRLAPLAHA